jgi:hypothetical protein
MNSPQQLHEVRLRGLGGPAACGVPGTCASATGSSDRIAEMHAAVQSAKADFAIFQRRIHSLRDALSLSTHPVKDRLDLRGSPDDVIG